MENKGEKPNPGYETREVSSKYLAISAIVLFLVLVLVLIGMRAMFSYLAVHQPPGPPASPITNARELPPQPQLQVGGRAQLREYLAGQRAELTSYGWVDRNAGTVRIPIAEAMKLLLKKGLPIRTSNERGAGQTRQSPLVGGPGSRTGPQK